MTTHHAFDTVLTWAAVAVPIIAFLAVITGTIVFVRWKGTMDGLKEAAATFETLASAYEQKSKLLEEEIAELKSKVAELEGFILVQREALSMAVDETVASVQRLGICARSTTCQQFTPPKPGRGI